jgi:hypothetical protein
MHKYFMLLLTGFLTCYFIGCYTVLRHPAVNETITTETETQMTTAHENPNMQDDCSKCHNANTYFSHSYTNNYYEIPEEQDTYPNWEYYYDSPWWNDYQFPTTTISKEKDSQPLPPTQKRDFQTSNNTPTPSMSTTTSASSVSTGQLSKSSSLPSSNNETTSSEDSSKRTSNQREADSKPKSKKKDND